MELSAGANSNSIENEDDIQLPRTWDYKTRWVEDFTMKFRGKQIVLKQSPKGSRVGATVWDIVNDPFDSFDHVRLVTIPIIVHRHV